MKNRKICNCVGIDNGGEKRIEELSPFKMQNTVVEMAKIVKFIVEKLKPYIDKNYRTKPSKNTTIGGSSLER